MGDIIYRYQRKDHLVVVDDGSLLLMINMKPMMMYNDTDRTVMIMIVMIINIIMEILLTR